MRSRTICINCGSRYPTDFPFPVTMHDARRRYFFCAESRLLWISQLSRDARERVQLFPFRGEQQKKYNVNELTIDRLEFDRFPKTSQDAKGLL